MDSERIDTSYEPFSREPEYIDLNRLFVRQLGLNPRSHRRFLDLACGTGTLTELILDDLREKADRIVSGQQWTSQFVGIELSRESLLLAKKHFAELGVLAGRDGTVTVSFVEASGDRLPLRPGSVDVVTIGNAIHCFPDKRALLTEIRVVLRPRGLFAFNSAFYSGTIVPGSETFYTLWIKESLKYIQAKDAEARRHGERGVPRVRGSGKPAFTNPWHSPAEYSALLEWKYFKVLDVVERTLMMTQHSFETVGAYAGLAVVLLSGYPPRLACEALMKSVGPALAAARMDAVPRRWLEMTAVKL